MDKFVGPVLEGIQDSWVVAFALLAAVAGGIWRVFSRVGLAYAHHKPIPVAPGKAVKTS